MSAGAGAGVIALDPRRRVEAARMLGRAFRNNPAMVAALRGVDEAARVAKIARIFGGLTTGCLAYGHADAIVDGHGDAIVGAALTYPPGAYPLSALGWLRSGVPTLAIGLGHVLRFMRIDAWMRKHHLVEPHFYLAVLGVEPSHKGRGLGGRLLRALNARADAAAAPCYLETDAPENVGLYQHHGYDVIAEGEPLPGTTMWLMLRPAR
jgi:ribosomal protein S18 acetylase RimI-like enzyme